ncbi:MAG: hypothetical protein JXR03_12085 [Cyclobacteriaceae bacterium]
MKHFFAALLSIFSVLAFSQGNFSESGLIDLRIYIDTLSYSWEEDKILFRGAETLPFIYREESEVAEIYIYFDLDKGIKKLELIGSSDFQLLDSIFMIEDHARFKVKFKELTKTDFLKFTFKVHTDYESVSVVDVPLFPHTDTYVKYYPSDDQLFIGEEKVSEITTNRPSNIVIDSRWTEGLPINYKLTKKGKQILLHLEPNKLGRQSISVPITLKKPMYRGGEIVYQADTIKYTFSIKSGRLAFLQMDVQEITPSDDKKQPIEIQIENHRFLKIGKTYRIEDQEEAGGALVGEIFTKNLLNNDKVLCLFRPYAFHRKADGYLYIKDGDKARFVTNVDLTPKTTINDIYIQREGKEWENTNDVYPGENLNVRIEGLSLHKAQFGFAGIENLNLDSLIRNEKNSLFSVKIPYDIRVNKVEIFNHGENTGKFLKVNEFQRPRDFDFMSLELGDEVHQVDKIDKPIYFEHNLPDLVIVFDREKIDQNQDLYGKQYLSIKVKISDKNGHLIELYQFNETVICPDESSVRSAHYPNSVCHSGGINLNNYISKKTYNLDEWSKIELEISHSNGKYKELMQRKKILVYLKRNYNFDIDVSFPGGLLILESGKNKEFKNFSGVSFAMLGQFSFYQEGKIAKYRPYKVGAGFIAINAFNFSENATNRDVGLVVIGSVYPSAAANRKLTFPLYAGFGYLMKEQKLFSLIGPGIRVRF